MTSMLNFFPAVMAEWLRRLTRNQMGSSRVGSNPTHSDVTILKKGVITLLTYTWKSCMHSTNYPHDLHGTHKGKKKHLPFSLRYDPIFR